MRRYAAVQKARDADVFGILVGTLGVGEYSYHVVHPTQIKEHASYKRPTFR
jgi:diphthamide biosynthesis protein 2